MDINDSLSIFPAYDLYCQWDTTTINPHTFDVNDFIDANEIILNDPKYCGYHHPFPGYVTSDFGYRRGRFHYGIDIDLETGDSVRSAFEGRVRIAKWHKAYGNVVVVRHYNGLETLYAHFSKIKVRVGQQVDAGTVLGLGGKTGRATGSHLHFEVRYLGQPIDPGTVVDFSQNDLSAEVLTLNKKHVEYIIKMKSVRYHTIKKGDTLYGIAKRYGKTVNQLCQLNNIKSSSTLRIGNRIRYQ